MMLDRSGIVGLASGLLLAVFLGCNDVPTEALDEPPPPGISLGKGGQPKLSLDYARVKSDGTLVDGTALSAVRIGPGQYEVTFARPTAGCAGVAGSSGFPGADAVGSTITAHVFVPGSQSSDATVFVGMATPSVGEEDTAFSLILICPPA
jgi:hypothetical protein